MQSLPSAISMRLDCLFELLTEFPQPIDKATIKQLGIKRLIISNQANQHLKIKTKMGGYRCSLLLCCNFIQNRIITKVNQQQQN